MDRGARGCQSRSDKSGVIVEVASASDVDRVALIRAEQEVHSLVTMVGFFEISEVARERALLALARIEVALELKRPVEAA